MKKHAADFFKRGLMAAGGGPLIVAIVYKLLAMNHIVETMTVDEMVLAVVTSAVLAFLAAGISVIYDLERLPLMAASLIHSSMLFLVYLVIYMVNGWITAASLPIFIAIFLAAYLAIWCIVYFSLRRRVQLMNRRLQA